MCSNVDMKTALLSFALLISTAGFPAYCQDNQSAGQDMKDAGRETKNAAKDVGSATKKGAKKTGKAAKKGVNKGASETEKGANKVEDKTRDTNPKQ